jgi:CRISPR-associated protein Csb3
MSSSGLVLQVDLANPGQFLACCGLFELASRLSAEATAKFGEGRFTLDDCPADVLDRFIAANVTADQLAAIAEEAGSEDDADADGEKSPPVRISAPFNLRLDWWAERTAIRAGFKTWAGGQTVLGFMSGMQQFLRAQDKHGATLLQEAIPIKQPKPFYFDARLSRLTALDAGFSAEKFTSVYSPATELLALVGLQRFRPVAVEPRERYAYSTWDENLPLIIAGAVAHGLIPSLASDTYEFPLVVRTGGKYKAFGPSTPVRRIHE